MEHFSYLTCKYDAANSGTWCACTPSSECRSHQSSCLDQGMPSLYNWLATLVHLLTSPLMCSQSILYTNVEISRPQRVLHSIFCNRILLSIMCHGRIDRLSISGPSINDSRFGFTRPSHHVQTRISQCLDITNVLPDGHGTESVLAGLHTTASHLSADVRAPLGRSELEGDESGVYTGPRPNENELATLENRRTSAGAWTILVKSRGIFRWRILHFMIPPSCR